MPIAGYVDFGACVQGMQDKQGYDKETAEKVCGAIEQDLKKSEIGSKYLDELKEEYGTRARLFVGNLSVDVKDKEGDQITLEAFKKVMPIFMRRGVLIDSHTNRVIGKPRRYWTDEDSGATTVGWQIYDDYHIDDEAWEKIRNGTYEGMSIGGFAHPDGQETVCDSSGCKVVINEIELWEGSAVKRGANTEAVILAHNDLAKSDIAGNSGNPGETATCDGDSCEIVPGMDIKKVPIMPDDSGILTKSEKTMTDETKKTKDAEDTGSVEDSVDSAGTEPAKDAGAGTGTDSGDGGGGGEVEKQDPDDTVSATVDEKLDAVIELLQNVVGRVEVLEEVTAPAIEEKQDDEPKPEPDEDVAEIEKSATELATEVATKAIDQVANALPGMINKSLKNAGIIHAPRPEMKEGAGKPLEKSEDKIVSMEDVAKMNLAEVDQAGGEFMNSRIRGDR
ncbi:MAG: HK97 family phage prohead protease [Methanosarcinaceae archaeon]